MRDSTLHIKDILEAFRAIREFVKGMDLEAFRRNDLVSSAVIRKFEIVGEAAKRVPESIRQRYPEIPWEIRDRLIHAYFNVKHELVWETITHELPRLEPLLQKVLRDLEGSRGG